MSNSNPAYNDRVQYELEYLPYGKKIIQDPQNWESDGKEFARNKEYHGIFTNFSNALTFVGNGADYIREVEDLYGVNSNVRLTKRRRHPQTDIWETEYTGFLDLSTIEEENGNIKVKFNSGGIEQLLKARESEQVEIERTTTMDGAEMDPIKIDRVFLGGRQILLNSLFNVQETDNTASIYNSAGPSSGGSDRAQSVGVPLNLYSKSHEEAQSILPQTTANENTGTTGIMFFAVSTVARTLHIKINISFRSNVYRTDDVNHAFWGIYIGKYQNGTSYNLVNRTKLFDSTDQGGYYQLGGDAWANPFTGANDNPAKEWSVEWEGDITLAAGQSLSLECYSKANLGGTFHDGSFGVRAENIIADVRIIEDSFYEASQSKFVLAYELCARLFEIMTGNKTGLKSNILGRTDIGYTQDGKASLNGFTHGFWVRGFDKEPPSTEDNVNNFKQLTTSWKDFITSMQATWNIGLGIERKGYTEKVVIEDLKYFYRQQVTIKLPNKVNKVKRSIATEYYYSGVEIGYTKGGDYSEAMGLDEYNAKSTFTTSINRLQSTFSKLSIYRADSYGKEFARRKPKTDYPTEDTTYDNDIFIMDLKRAPEDTGAPNMPFVFQERKWQDDFAKAPTGTYSPETATNLRLSPMNMILRHGWVIAAGLTKYLTEFLRYGSSTGNSALATQLMGGNEYAENSNIVNKELGKPRYVPIYKEFEHDVDTALLKEIQGTTVIDGEEVPNVYGLIEFTNEKNQPERGYLINLKPNEGKFKVLISNS